MTLGTLLLMLLQRNAAHLGIATGLCISEAVTIHLPRRTSLPTLGSAVLAAISTALAETLCAAAIALLATDPFRTLVIGMLGLRG